MIFTDNQISKEPVMATKKTFTTRIDLAPDTREKMIALLNQ